MRSICNVALCSALYHREHDIYIAVGSQSNLTSSVGYFAKLWVFADVAQYNFFNENYRYNQSCRSTIVWFTAEGKSTEETESASAVPGPSHFNHFHPEVEASEEQQR